MARTFPIAVVDRLPRTTTQEHVDRPLANTRVLIATESLGPINGVTRATEQLLRHFATEGIEAAAIAPAFAASARASVPEGMPCIRLKGMSLAYNPELRIVRPFRMREIYRRTFRPDVIYLASPATVGFQVWWQTRNAGIPLVANFQTDLASYACRMLPGYLGAAAEWGADQLTRMMYRDPAVRAVLCPSTMSREYLMRLGVREGKIHIVRRGVNCVLFDPAKRSAALRRQLAPRSETLLLCVSRLSLEKGFDFLAEAYAKIVAKVPHRNGFPPVRLIITGDNANPTIARTIRGYFAARGLDVHFTGTLTGEALATMYATADIFVFPSQTETFGQVIQEAMASGLPVVAQRIGGPADLVRDGIIGYLATPSDIDGFAEKTLRLIHDQDLRTRMGHTARAIAEKRDWETVNRQIAHLIAEAAS